MSKKKEVAFLIGPYRANNDYNLKRHIDEAWKVSTKYWARGFIVIAPQLNTQYMSGIIPEEEFLDAYHVILKMCDVIIIMENSDWSEGSRDEIKLGKKYNKRIIIDN